MADAFGKDLEDAQNFLRLWVPTLNTFAGLERLLSYNTSTFGPTRIRRYAAQVTSLAVGVRPLDEASCITSLGLGYCIGLLNDNWIRAIWNEDRNQDRLLLQLFRDDPQNRNG